MPRTKVLLFTQQPFVGRGLAAVLETRPDFELVACHDELADTIACLKSEPPDVAVIYLTSGISLSDLRELRSADWGTPIVLWGKVLSGELLFQVMQLGIRGVIPSDTPVDALLAALQKIGNGGLCFETEVMDTILDQKRVVLTEQESQLVALVAQGLKNKEIADSLGLTEGTVKGYVTRIFKKLGMNDRLDLALYGLTNLFGGEMGSERSGETPNEGVEQNLVSPRSLPLRSRDRTPIRFLN